MAKEKLIEAALAAKNNAYTPYSQFSVGAALLTSKGNIYTGCNVENASSGLTVCAERTAVVNAVSNGERDFVLLAVAGDLTFPTSPCGACRQVLYEFSPHLGILLVTKDGYQEVSLAELLPKAFGPHDLKRGEK